MDLFWALAAFRWVQLSAIVILFGSALFALYAGTGPSGAAARRRDVALAGLALAATALWAASSLVDMTEDVASITSLQTWRDFLFATSFGWVWVFRILALIVLCFAVVLLNDGRTRAVVTAGLAGTLLASQAWLGHTGAGHGNAKIAAIAAYDVHALAAGAWLGGLVPLVALLREKRGAAGGNDAALARTLRRFSILGMTAVALIVISGVVNGVLRLDSPLDLITSPYGQILLLKLSVFVLVLGLAALNRFRYTPLIERGDADGSARAHLTRSVLSEQLLALVILGLAVLLASVAPPH